MQDKYNFDKRTQSGKFDVQVDSGAQYGYFEHTHYGDECGGGLWFKDNALIDYDGVAALPMAVVTGLRDMGFTVADEFI